MAWLIIEGILLVIFIAAVFISLKNHRMGDLIIYYDAESGNKVFSLELEKHPEEIENMKFVIFVVKNQLAESQNKQGL